MRYYAPGENCPDPSLGALVLVRHHGLAAKLIRFGEWLHLWLAHTLLRKPMAPWWRVTHAMTVVQVEPVVLVSEQVGRGGKISKLASYVHDGCAVVDVIDTVTPQRQDAANVGWWYASVPYGWPSIASDATYILTGLPVFLTVGQSAVCSAAASYAQRCLGLIPDKPDVAVMPSDHARYYDVLLPLTWPTPSSVD